MEQLRRITVDEYIEEYEPCGSWVLVEKDPMADSFGKIIIPDLVKKGFAKWGCTGVIKKMPHYKVLDDENAYYRAKHFKVGDKVGFGATVPMLSPAPSYYQFDDSQRAEHMVTLHICDLAGIINDTPEKREEYKKRFEEV